MKRFIAPLLAVVLVAGLMPAPALATGKVQMEAASALDAADAVMAATAAGVAATGVEPAVATFADENLYEAVVGQLPSLVGAAGFEADETTLTVRLTGENVAKVDKLDVSNREITSLAGLGAFSALEELDCSNNRIASLEPVAGLAHLKRLRAHGCLIDNAALAEVTGASAFPALTSLDLSANLLADAAGDAGSCTTGKLSALTGLEELDLASNRLRFAAGLEKLGGLGHLDLYDNYVHDLTPLAGLTSLTHLDLGENNEALGAAPLPDASLAALDGLENLEYLDFSENQTPNVVDHLANMGRLKTLQLEKNNLADVSALAGHEALETLVLCNNGIADIGPLLGLANMRELNLARNALAYTAADGQAASAENDALFGVFGADGGLAWPRLDKLDLTGNFHPNWSTYQQPPELAALYALSATGEAGALELGYNYRNVAGFDVGGRLHVDDATGVTYTTYQDFGARCDGTFDDYIAIYNAHVFSERNFNCEVRAVVGPGGAPAAAGAAGEAAAGAGAAAGGAGAGAAAGVTFHIFKPYDTVEAQILGDVDWQGATFAVHDEGIERTSGRFAHLFWGQETQSNDCRTLTGADLEALGVTRIGTETKALPQLAGTLAGIAEASYLCKKTGRPYERYLCRATDANKKQFIRSGDQGSGGAAQLDSFIIDADGTLRSDVQWDFSAVTELRIVPIPNERHFARNATFSFAPVESGCEAPFSRPGKPDYYQRNVCFCRSNNFEVSGIEHRVEADGLSGSYMDLVELEQCADVTVRDCTLNAQKFERPGRSSYSLALFDCTGVELRGLRERNGITDATRWADMGGNYLKDVRVEDCVMNVLDAHSGVYNLDVSGSTIGRAGIAVVGQGTMNVTDTTIVSDRPVQLRGDYGSTWNGRVNLVRCTWKPLGRYRGRLFAIDFSFTDGGSGDWWDYGYPCRFPDVYVEGLVIDEELNRAQPDCDVVANGLWAFYSREGNVGKVPASYWPTDVVVNGVTFENAGGLSREPRLHLTTTDLGTIRAAGGDYLACDVSALVDGKDAARRLLAGEHVSTAGPVKVGVSAGAVAATAAVEVRRNGVVERKRADVDGAWEETFSAPGSYEVRVASTTDEHGWAGERTLAFDVTGELAKGNVTLSGGPWTYDGKAKRPAVAVTAGDRKLAAGVDYTVSYAKNVDAGTASVTVSGKGALSGTVRKTFTIARKKVTPAVALSKAKLAYTGKAVKPKVSVWLDAKRKTKLGQKGYTLAWKANKDVGKASVKVALSGNYTGSRTVTFTIVPKAVALKSVKATKRGFKATWARQAKQAGGYRLQYATRKDFKAGCKTVSIANAKTTARAVKGLKAGKRYWVRVRTFKKADGKTYYSAWSKAKAVTAKR